MEYEVRYFYPQEKLEKLHEMLSKIKELKKGLRTYEKTTQFNHCDSRFDFYSKEIDGRFRVRVSSNDESTSCKLSWKRRIPGTRDTEVNKEEEKEVHIPYEDLDNFLFIIKNVMHFTLTESYERYRTVYTNDEVEICIDEFPFGLALEVENKSVDKDPEETVKKWVSLIGLDINEAYRYSWDDKYTELCKEQNIEKFDEVSFNNVMPKVK